MKKDDFYVEIVNSREKGNEIYQKLESLKGKRTFFKRNEFDDTIKIKIILNTENRKLALFCFLRELM